MIKVINTIILLDTFNNKMRKYISKRSTTKTKDNQQCMPTTVIDQRSQIESLNNQLVILY